MKRVYWLIVGLIVLALGFYLLGCGASGGNATTTTTQEDQPIGGFTFTSITFDSGGAIPTANAYTAITDGQNHSPHLTWSPASSPDVLSIESYVLTMVDTTLSAASGEDIYHWVVIDISDDDTIIAARASQSTGNYNTLSSGTELTNSFDRVGYEGPWPDEEHTYTFKIYALNVASIDLAADTRMTQALFDAQVTEAKIVQSKTLTGTFTP
ncbi:MAG: YbhB/YbcL family Raf kinase inhibitor-like protein [bacterium]